MDVSSQKYGNFICEKMHPQMAIWYYLAKNNGNLTHKYRVV